MWIIVELDGYGTGCFSRSYSGAIGPFSTKEEAEDRCEELNDHDLYAVEFKVEELTLRHWTDSRER